MSGFDAQPDPLDFHRACIFEHARDLAAFCEIVMKLTEMGKDDHAHTMFDAAAGEMAHLKMHFTSLGRGLAQQRQEEQFERERRLVKAREIAERRASRHHEGADVADA